MERLKSLDTRQSEVINAMRFPLIVLVLYMHIVPIDPFPIKFDGSVQYPLYNFIAEFIAHNLGRLAVPCFFLISGFLYFKKIETWTTTIYFEQQRKRFHSLILPYLLWNVLNILIYLAKGYGFESIGLDGTGDINYIKSTSLWELMISPINQPLWYLRDLICMTFLSPLFYYLFKYTKLWGLGVIYLVYLFTLELPIRGFSMTAIFFFGLGSYWSIYKQNILEQTEKIKWIAYIIALVSVIVATFYSTSPSHEYMMRIFAPFGVISTFNIFSILSNRTSFHQRMISLSPMVFFIYSVHELYLKNWTKGAFYRTPLSNSEIGMIIGYFIMPLILLAICIGIYYVCKRIMPRFTKVLSGGR